MTRGKDCEITVLTSLFNGIIFTTPSLEGRYALRGSLGKPEILMAPKWEF